MSFLVRAAAKAAAKGVAMGVAASALQAGAEANSRRVGNTQTVAARPGWYPDPRDPRFEWLWDGVSYSQKRAIVTGPGWYPDPQDARFEWLWNGVAYGEKRAIVTGPGWYPDPRNSGLEWYWNGSAYGEWREVSVPAAPKVEVQPEPKPRPEPVEPVADPVTARQPIPVASPAPTKLVPAICTQCGGRLEVDPSLEAAVCPFCRTPYIVDKAINNYAIQQTTIEHADTVIQRADKVHIRQGAVASVVGFVERQVKRKQDQEDEEARREAEAKRKQVEREEEERKRIDALPPFWRFLRKHGIELVVVVMIIGILAAIATPLALGAMTSSPAPDANGNLTVPESSASFAGEDYHAVVEKLSDRGFTDVETSPLGDLITGWLTEPDSVDKVTVAGNPDYDTSRRYPPSVPIVVYYHSFPVEDEPTPAATTPSAVAPTDAAAPVVDTTVDELLERLNSADLGGIRTGDRFRISAELFESDAWSIGATGEFVVFLKAKGGADDLFVFVDGSDAAHWQDGTVVEMVVESVERTVSGERTGGWLKAVSVKTVSGAKS